MKRRLLALFTLVLLATTGCTSIPSSGAPEAFTIQAPDRDPLDQTATGPRVDSTPEQLVSDFLRASQAGSSDDYQTARQYLTVSAAATWQPEAAVLIYAADEVPRASFEGTSRVVLSVRTKGSLSEEGVFTGADNSEAKLSFDMVRNSEGQWRINSLDNGVILSQPSFTSAFQAVQLYFLTPSQDSLVPDSRWLPRKRLSSHLMNSLIAGPRAELEDAVYTTLNSSFALPTQGIEIGEDQVARVSLVGELPEGDVVREHLAWQVTATLSQVSSTTGVEIEVNGAVLPPVEPPFGPRLRLDRAVGIRDNVVVEGENEVWVDTGVTLEEGEGHPAVGPASDSVLAWTSDTEVHVRNGEEQLEFPVDHPLPPVIDRWGWTWTAATDEPAILALGPDGQRESFPVDFADATPLTALTTAPDGIRLALVSGKTNALTLHVIVRDGQGTPVSLGAGIVQPLNERVMDVAWAGPTNLVALLGEGEDTQVATLPLSGFAQIGGAPSGVTSITAGSTTSRVYLQDPEGILYARAGALWRPLGSDVLQVHFPG